jgi:fumarate reductase flavoprotein subunit
MESRPPRWNEVTDVVIVGAGGTGLAAAVSAAAEGAKVVVLEACPYLGGTTGIAVGSLTASCTTMQEAAGIIDDSEWHTEDMGKFTPVREPLNNASLRRFLACESANTLSWLMGLGLKFHGPNPEPPNRVPRMHNVVPNAKAYIAVLQRNAIRHGAKILAGRRVTQIYREPNGAVTGVGVDGPECLWAVQARRGVILAAGDYSNGSIKSEYLPPEIAAVEGVNPNARGDGHRLALEAGGQLVNMDIVYGPEIRFIPPPKQPFTQLLPANPLIARIMGKCMDLLPNGVISRVAKRLLVTWQHPEIKLLEKGAILVNGHGERFTNETSTPELAIPRQPDRIAYILLDQQLAEEFSQWPNFISTAPDIAYAYIQDYERLRPDVCRKANSIADLADKMGVPATTLEQTVVAYNQAAKGSITDPLGRASFGAPLTQPPYWALGPVRSWIVTTEGGVRVNQNMEVLDQFGAVIPGLYAGGSNGMGGMIIWGHGLHIAWAMTSGRIAGRNAARAADRSKRTAGPGNGDLVDAQSAEVDRI